MAFERDWLFLREALPDLRDYILSSDVYRPLRTRAAGGLKLPQLTIGSLMLSQARLGALELPGQQEAELAEISRRINEVRQEWRVNWGNKAGREFGSRMNLWQQYLRELRGDPGRNAPIYPNEVRLRAIISLLHSEVTDLVPGQEEQLGMLDQILRGLSKPGSFVWEIELANGFPQEDFWFLYVIFAGQAR
jgi:hypothetical protein